MNTYLPAAERRGPPIPIRNPQFSGSVKDRLGDQVNPAAGLPTNPYFDTNAWERLPDD